MSTDAIITGYRYSDASQSCAHPYLLPAVHVEADRALRAHGGTRRMFDLGCGNGSVAGTFAQAGWEVLGVDPSREGIAAANLAYPELRLECGSAYDDLAARFGQYPVVVSLEVVEHVYAPRTYARTLFDLVEAGGTAIISTPYHGYLKNLSLALAGKMDVHFTALWDHGHIKFWSVSTLGSLLEEAGFTSLRFQRMGRIPLLAKSMIAVAEKPTSESAEGSFRQ